MWAAHPHPGPGLRCQSHLGEGEHTVLAAVAVVLSPLGSAVGNVMIKLRGAKLDPLVMNGWAMLIGGAALLLVSGASEDWGSTVWSLNSLGSVRASPEMIWSSPVSVAP